MGSHLTTVKVLVLPTNTDVVLYEPALFFVGRKDQNPVRSWVLTHPPVVWLTNYINTSHRYKRTSRFWILAARARIMVKVVFFKAARQDNDVLCSSSKEEPWSRLCSTHVSVRPSVSPWKVFQWNHVWLSQPRLPAILIRASSWWGWEAAAYSFPGSRRALLMRWGGVCILPPWRGAFIHDSLKVRVRWRRPVWWMMADAGRLWVLRRGAKLMRREINGESDQGLHPPPLHTPHPFLTHKHTLTHNEFRDLMHAATTGLPVWSQTSSVDRK